VRNLIRIAFVLLALAATDAAFAQQTVLYQVQGWSRISTRDDNKGIANSFRWGVGSTGAPTMMGPVGAGQAKVTVQDASLSIPAGDAALLFAQAALRGQRLQGILVEFSLTKGDPKGMAPFAFRLSDVAVTSVLFSKSGQDGVPGVAEVTLSAQKVELFSGTQDPKTGRVSPGPKAGFDVGTNKAF
jgi:hypothetical protein